MQQTKPHTLSGFMELLPGPQQQMERMMAVLRETYALYGFTPLDTPVIEAADVLLAKGGGETEKQIYRFQKGDSDLALRFDLTVPLAKYVALHYGELSFPLHAAIRSARCTAASGRRRGRFRRILSGRYRCDRRRTSSPSSTRRISPAIIYQYLHRAWVCSASRSA